MKLSDLIQDALATLWRQKLRSALTISGVVVAIGALVVLLSFSFGMQKNLNDQINKFRLLQMIRVEADSEAVGTDSSAVFDSTALAWMAELPGVMQVMPSAPFSARVIWRSDTVSAGAQALPRGAGESLLFEHVTAGSLFEPGNYKSAIITTELLSRLEVEEADSLLGETLILYSKRSDPDSGLAAVREELGHVIGERGMMLSIIRQRQEPDSVFNLLLSRSMTAYMRGITERTELLTDTVTVTGVIEVAQGWAEQLRPLIVSDSTARYLSRGNMADDPMALLESFSSGGGGLAGIAGITESYEQATLELSTGANHQPIADSLRARGYEVHDFAEAYSEIQRAFAMFTGGMTLLGFIALFVAGLGIVNTMIMSILERRREIGVLKALGAEDGQVRVLFLVESAVIGLLGALFGLLLGWVVSEIAGAIIRFWMEKEGVGAIDMFYLDWLTVLIAIAFGVVISTIAGLYPAARAARLDPVQALREE